MSRDADVAIFPTGPCWFAVCGAFARFQTERPRPPALCRLVEQRAGTPGAFPARRHHPPALAHRITTRLASDTALAETLRRIDDQTGEPYAAAMQMLRDDRQLQRLLSPAS